MNVIHISFGDSAHGNLKNARKKAMVERIINTNRSSLRYRLLRLD